MLKIMKSEINPSSMGHKTATVIIRADTLDEADSLAAKTLAYEQRLKLGLGERAGVEALGGAFPVAIDRTADEIAKLPDSVMQNKLAGYAYDREFKLAEML